MLGIAFVALARLELLLVFRGASVVLVVVVVGFLLVVAFVPLLLVAAVVWLRDLACVARPVAVALLSRAGVVVLVPCVAPRQHQQETLLAPTAFLLR